MKLLTLNVHAWLEDNQLEKIDTLARAIADNDYDVIALQEVNQTITAEIVENNLKKDNYLFVLLEFLKKYTDTTYKYFWSNSHIGYDKYDEGIAILTKHNASYDEFYCTKITDINSIEARKIVSASFSYEGESVEFYSCHINLPTSKKENQLDNITNIISRTTDNKLKFFMGDFNTDALSNKQAYTNILNLGIYDTYNLAEEKCSGVTVGHNIDGWKDSKGEKRLDYIFTNRLIDVEYSKVIFNGYNYNVVSDHYGLEIRIKIK
ncbi:endonuclease/exonuclease/phosphatase family protein [Gemella sp. GH3]|uniref:endonuclease/exonuclease/phosphatase family protein n=1 Tax=unclassified Gemella TaxID=2624949 RepID=UPI0015CFE49B|nr:MULTISPECIES: endonuclease/exonuclease/phosphatase family protein [unclassified Gemella]MBF0713787.1 endonuclease/exonuclease/phosphatase family protein [Gemella sp. GH3.1]NYS50739.1 endonuclease/exonuclease/phosphatase family protein [Gemella sp. GH3]